MKQDRPAFEDRDVAIRQPWHLAKGLVREMLRAAIAKRRAFDAIGQPGFFQRPAHANVAHEAPRHLGNPIVCRKDKFNHSGSPSACTELYRLRALQNEGELWTSQI